MRTDSRADMEIGILGGILFIDRGWDEWGHDLQEWFFRFKPSKVILNAMRVVAESGGDPDVFNVSELCQAKGWDDSGWVGKASANFISGARMADMISALKSSASCDLITQAGERIARLSGTAEERYNALQAIVADLDAPGERGPVAVKESLPDWFQSFTEKAESGREVVGVRTGHPDIDRRLGGMRGGDFIVLAGRPSMGKTSLAMDIAWSVAEREVCGVAVFSMEMETESLLDRSVSSHSSVPLHAIRSPVELADTDWPKITHAMSKIQKAPVYIDDEPSLAIGSVHARSRRLARMHDVGLIVLDYIQLAQANRRYENRRDHVAAVSRGIKRLAKDLDIPVIALSQLNRKCEDRPDKRPVMADLAESGALEQDADAIGFLYRDEVYNAHSQHKGLCEVIWRKVRNGSQGTDWLWFDGARQVFRQALKSDIPLNDPSPTSSFEERYGKKTKGYSDRRAGK